MRTALILLSILVAGCGATQRGEDGDADEGNGAMSSNEAFARDRAIQTARALGAREGYPEADYELESVERVTEGARAGRWLVSFTHVPPTPPGGHFGVYVDPETWEGDLVHGE